MEQSAAALRNNNAMDCVGVFLRVHSGICALACERSGFTEGGSNSFNGR